MPHPLPGPFSGRLVDAVCAGLGPRPRSRNPRCPGGGAVGAGLGARSEPWGLCWPGGEVMGVPALAVRAVLMGQGMDAGLEPHPISRVLFCPEKERVVTRGFVSHSLPKAPACPAGVLSLGLMLVLRPYPTLVRKGLGAALGLISLPRPHTTLEQQLGLWSSSSQTTSCPWGKGVAAGAIMLPLPRPILPRHGRWGFVVFLKEV